MISGNYFKILCTFCYFLLLDFNNFEKGLVGISKNLKQLLDRKKAFTTTRFKEIFSSTNFKAFGCWCSKTIGIQGKTNLGISPTGV